MQGPGVFSISDWTPCQISMTEAMLSIFRQLIDRARPHQTYSAHPPTEEGHGVERF